MFANFATALPAGAAMTFLLLFGMHSLIAMQPGAAVEEIRTPLPPFVRIPKKEELYKDEFVPERLPEPTPTPPLEPRVMDPVDNTPILVSYENPTPRPATDAPFSLGFSDGPLVTVVRVLPNYPPPMAARGIEGWVTVIFNVLPDGSVANIAVLESSHRGFERNAMRAASRFKYKARVVDGVPQASTGIRYRFTFEMDK